MSVLFTFTGEFTFLHRKHSFSLVSDKVSRCNFTLNVNNSQDRDGGERVCYNSHRMDVSSLLDSRLFVAGITLISVLLSMTLHEAMHAFTGHWLGDTTASEHGRLTLNPLKHIDPITTVALPVMLALSGLPPFGAAKPVPFNPFRVRYGEYGAALIGVAGPLTNLLLALATGGIIRIFTSMPELLAAILVVFAVVNVGFFVFNMIPFPPLDGSRLFYAFAPDSIRKFMDQIESLGFMGILIFMFVLYPFISGVVSNISGRILGILLGI